MTMLEEIEKGKQLIARCERSLALEKLKKHRAETRTKIELGGLVVKSGISHYNKAVILGALDYIQELILQNRSYIKLFEIAGYKLFGNGRLSKLK
ncbi:TPA: conjugal transfer protein TraD [Legionella pneumophila]|nr:conjugal transfer protein TraD [Legionella pneumophila]